MKILLKILKWFSIVFAGLLLILITVLGITGFPKPGTIVRSDNIPRIPWGSVYQNFVLTKNFIEGSVFIDWVPTGDGIYLLSKSGFLKRSFSVQNNPESSPVALEGIPQYAGNYFINPGKEKNFMVVSLDNEGDEQYQLYRYDFADQSLEQMTDGKGNCIGICFDPQRNKFLYANNKRHPKYFDFYLVDPENPDSNERIFTTDKIAQIPIAFSPVSENTLLVKDWRQWTAARLYILNITTGDMIPIEPDTQRRINHGADYTGAASPAIWSRDGKFIYYLSDKDSEFQQLHRYDVGNMKDQLLDNPVTWDIVELHATADENIIVYTTLEDGMTKLYRYDIAENSSRQLNLPWGYVREIKSHPSRNVLAINLNQTFFQTDIIGYDMEKDTYEYWYQKEREIIKPEKIYYSTGDTHQGKPLKIPAYIFKPKSTGKPCPVLIELHGGPVNHSSFLFFDLYKGVFDMGIAIISPNFRGSLGYGKSFELADNGFNRLNATKDVGALLDWISEQPDLDADRVGVIGASYGGYMVLSTLANYSDRITCGVDAFGISSLVTFLENSLEVFRDVRRSEMGDERIPEMRLFLESIAPVNNAKNISVPLFVYQGMQDTRVSPFESESIVNAVKKNGAEVWYIAAGNEGHGIIHPMNALYTTNAYYQFLKKYLGPPTD